MSVRRQRKAIVALYGADGEKRRVVGGRRMLVRLWECDCWCSDQKCRVSAKLNKLPMQMERDGVRWIWRLLSQPGSLHQILGSKAVLCTL